MIGTRYFLSSCFQKSVIGFVAVFPVGHRRSFLGMLRLERTSVGDLGTGFTPFSTPMLLGDIAKKAEPVCMLTQDRNLNNSKRVELKF